MSSADLLVDAFGRVKEAVHAAVDGLAPEVLGERVDESNSIAWLIWHLTRVQDDHVADVAGVEQVWTAKGWARRFDLPFGDAETGYAMSSEQVSLVQATAGLLIGYHDAVHEATVAYVQGLSDDDLARVVDTRWDPPVTLAVRLVSVIEDDLQHVGQAAFLRGIIERRSGR
jgi:uncharacterized damage-inducible protein DinB